MNKQDKYELYQNIIDVKDLLEETQLKYSINKTEENKELLSKYCIEITHKYDLLKVILLKEFINKMKQIHRK
jgi:hypothetical protein